MAVDYEEDVPSASVYAIQENEQVKSSGQKWELVEEEEDMAASTRRQLEQREPFTMMVLAMAFAARRQPRADRDRQLVTQIPRCEGALTLAADDETPDDAAYVMNALEGAKAERWDASMTESIFAAMCLGFAHEAAGRSGQLYAR
eukprot:4320455-Amphidinium_carterae.1